MWSALLIEEVCLVVFESHYLPDGGADWRIGFEVVRDSSLVTLELCDTRNRPVAVLVQDSLMLAGMYEVAWEPESRVRLSVYHVRLHIGEAVHVKRIRYRP